MRRYRIETDALPERRGGELSSSWAVQRLRDALAERGLLASAGIAGGTDPSRGAADDAAPIRIAIDPALGPETFAVEHAGEAVAAPAITGGDAAGVGLGCLHLVDLLRDGLDLASVPTARITSRFRIRALKVNLPWASYRQHRSLHLHDAAQRDPDFWLALLDHLAESRFNMLTLWAQHPFHYMVDVPEFPEARSMPIAELERWQELWRTVFAGAHDRGIQAHVFFWNIFVSPAFADAHGVAPYCRDWHHIGDGDQSSIVRDYNRAAVRTLIDTYDDLDGIGVAMSERMGGMTPGERGAWIEEVIVAGMNDAQRPAALCLRVPHSAGKENIGTMDRAAESFGRELLERVRAPGRLWTEVKFNWSHGHSSPHLRKIHGGPSSDLMWNPPPAGYEVAWMVRNEDFFVLRWAEPDFIREHIRENGLPGVGGYVTGSECHIPAADYITHPDSDARYAWAFERQWLFYQVWGRLLHDPLTPDGRFEALINRRYGEGVGAVLLPALRLASRVPLRIATFLNFTWDHTLYAEGMLNRTGVVTVDQLIDATPLEPGWMSVRRFVELGEPASVDAGRVTPLTIADRSEREADEALEQIAALGEPAGRLGDEVADVRAWAHLGLHFSNLLRAAIELARFDTSGREADRGEAVRLASRALAEWDRIVTLTERRYRPVPLQILDERPFSWAELRGDVARSIDIARDRATTRTPREPDQA